MTHNMATQRNCPISSHDSQRNHTTMTAQSHDRHRIRAITPNQSQHSQHANATESQYKHFRTTLAHQSQIRHTHHITISSHQTHTSHNPITMHSQCNSADSHEHCATIHITIVLRRERAQSHRYRNRHHTNSTQSQRTH